MLAKIAGGDKIPGESVLLVDGMICEKLLDGARERT